MTSFRSKQYYAHTKRVLRVSLVTGSDKRSFILKNYNIYYFEKYAYILGIIKERVSLTKSDHDFSNIFT